MNHIYIIYRDSIKPHDLTYEHQQVLTFEENLFFSIIRHVIEKGYGLSTRKNKMIYYLIIDTQRM